MKVMDRGLNYFENRTFDEIRVGDSASLKRTLSKPDIELFAVMSGDVNPTHLDEEFAKSDAFHKVVAHGMWGGALISAVLGTQLPGAGTVYVRQDLRFRRPVGVGETLTVTVTATAKDESTHRITFDCQCVNQDGVPVISGTAEVIAPTEKIRYPQVALPTIRFQRDFVHHKQLRDAAKGLEPIVTAVVHPCDSESLLGAIEAARSNLIVPVFVGPESKIRAVAATAEIDISPYSLVPAAHSHDAAEKAVALIRAGKAEVLMKGSLHTDELMTEVLRKDNGLRTSRRMSHVFIMDVPSYPRLLFITDAAINIDPTLIEKRDIVQNAIELAHALGVPAPKVAILSAVETVNADLRSTVDAAALCKMADRGQITGGILDGPLAFDNAVSQFAARTKGIVSPVAGNADILVVPDLESGNMLAKQLQYLAESQAAGVVLGARVPIILTSRADTALTRMTSAAVALLLVRRRRAVPQ
jgi:phosphate acetyltransferase/phosphate butyryltransferase